MDGGGVDKKARGSLLPLPSTNESQTPHPISEVRALADRDEDSPEKVANYAELQGGQGRDVYFRPDRYQRDLAGITLNLVENEIHRRRMRCPRKPPAFAVVPLTHGIVSLRRDTSGDGNVLPSRFPDQASGDVRSRFGVTE